MSVVRQEQLGWELCRCRCVQCHYLLGWLEACWLLSPSYHPALMSTEVGDKIKPKISSMEYKTSHDTTPYDKTFFSRVWSIKIAILFFGTSSKSYILWCSWGYCAVPTFLRVFPVSAPCLSSSFKSIYCSQKSIRLSEERCRFSGYGSVLPHFLLVSYASPPKEKKKDWPHWKVWVCASFFFFLMVMRRKRCHTSLKKDECKLNLFPLTAKSMEQVFHFLSQTHKKHFYARSNHITPCHHRSLGQAFVYTHSHSGHRVENFLSFSQSSLPCGL